MKKQNKNKREKGLGSNFCQGWMSVELGGLNHNVI